MASVPTCYALAAGEEPVTLPVPDALLMVGMARFAVLQSKIPDQAEEVLVSRLKKHHMH
jgi:hypothetical protein